MLLDIIIKQYTIGLPADYDMAIIRKRVADKAPAFDTFPGLGIKTFMIREKGGATARPSEKENGRALTITSGPGPRTVGRASGGP